MIRTKCGEVRINGNKATLLADLSCIVAALKDEGVAKESIQNSVEIGFMSEDEIDKEWQEIQEQVNAKLTSLLSDIANDLRGGNKDE